MFMGIWQDYIHDWTAHTKEELVIQVISVILILFFGMVAVKLIGKKSIARLTLIDVLFIFVLSSTLGALITKPVRIFVALLVIVTIIIFVFVLQKLQLKLDSVETLIQGKSELIYVDGRLNEYAMRKNNLTVDIVESAVRQQGLPSIEACKRIVLETTGVLSFEVLPEYEPIKKIYFDAAMKQIMKAINDSTYTEAKLPDINNAFQEVDKNQPSTTKTVQKHLE